MSANLTGGETGLNWQTKVQISVPSLEKERRWAIRCVDWNRLVGKLSGLRKPVSGLSTAYSILFGVSGSAFLSTFAVAYSQGLPAWVCPLYICVALFSCITGVVFLRLDSELTKAVHTSIDEFEADMKSIGDTFASSAMNGTATASGDTVSQASPSPAQSSSPTVSA